MEKKYCQSCTMPMDETGAMHGKEVDGKVSVDYCKYCYENGEFTFQAQWKK